MTDLNELENSKTEEVKIDPTNLKLRSYIERVENLEEQKKNIQTDIKDIFAEAKSQGFDVKALRQILRLRKMSDAERYDLEAAVDTYRKILNI